MSRLLRLTLVVTIMVVSLAQVSTALADGGTHVVQRGETLFRISLKYGVTVDALRAANGIVGNTIYAGQVLVIPGSASGTTTATPVTDPQPAPASDGVHVVQRGDNLFRIGLKYGVTVQALQAANNLPGTKIYAGQRLIIPTGAGTGNTSAAPAEAPASTTQPSASSAPAGGGRRFLVDLSEQMLYAYEGDTLVRSTLISSGRWPTVTVTGTYYIYLKYTAQRMRGPGYDLPGVPYVMYFYQGYALHGTYWHNNFGTPMSHGCVNMPTAEAEWAFNWASIGTPVTVQQ
ncbi:MAG TPA: LysM peptidoglycan-binding domain-containing protein [Anaerolineales bacterium]|nr:LysM peptidoglycan-binding domain-containing protein [Anaerolineales bacterium]